MNLKLTKSEFQLLEIFWEAEKPLTSIDVSEKNIKETWSKNRIQNMIRSLIKKELLKEQGTVKYNTQYARTFLPTITKEEYTVKSMLDQKFSGKFLSKVMVGLVSEEKEETKEEVIRELEDIIKELRS